MAKKPATTKKPVKQKTTAKKTTTKKTTRSTQKKYFHEELKTPQQVRHFKFAQKYVELNHNGTQAYLAIYGEEYKLKYKKEMSVAVARTNASRLLTHANVKAYVEQITHEALIASQISVDSVLAKYKKWSEFDVSSVLEWKREEILNSGGVPYEPRRYRMVLLAKDMKDIPPDAWDCIESVSQGKDGFKITPVSKKGANDMLARYLGLDKKVVEGTGEFILHFDSEDAGLL